MWRDGAKRIKKENTKSNSTQKNNNQNCLSDHFHLIRTIGSKEKKNNLYNQQQQQNKEAFDSFVFRVSFFFLLTLVEDVVYLGTDTLLFHCSNELL